MAYILPLVQQFKVFKYILHCVLQYLCDIDSLSSFCSIGAIWHWIQHVYALLSKKVLQSTFFGPSGCHKMRTLFIIWKDQIHRVSCFIASQIFVDIFLIMHLAVMKLGTPMNT